jgi:hypothetical protein
LFNSLKYTKILEESGLPRNQAEAHMQIMTAVVEEDMATKADLKELKTDLKSEMRDFKNDIIIKLGLLTTFVVPTSMALLQSLLKS